MKLLAGSLNVEFGGFLHAGYISACPRSFGRSGAYRLEGPTKLINVKKALELKGPHAQTAATAEVASRSRPLQPGSMVSEGFTLVIAFFFFVWLLSLYYRRVRKMERAGWRPCALVGTPILLYLLIVHWAIPACTLYRLNNLAPPWETVAVQDYADPEEATLAILHGLVVNGLAGSPRGVTGLAAIRGEVAFPVPAEDYTPGMVYAEKTYGRDGWAREFAFAVLDNGRYRVASAGPDGEHGTEDDIVLVTAPMDTDWEFRVSGVYIRPVAGENVCFVHRIDHPHFRTNDGEKAQALTNSNLFDAFSLEQLFQHHTGKPAFLERLKPQEQPRQPDENNSPLYFVQFVEKANG